MVNKFYDKCLDELSVKDILLYTIVGIGGGCLSMLAFAYYQDYKRNNYIEYKEEVNYEYPLKQVEE